MKCRCLKGEKKQLCTATDQTYSPSSFELKEYCRSGRFRLCPFYQTNRPGQVPEDGRQEHPKKRE